MKTRMIFGTMVVATAALLCVGSLAHGGTSREDPSGEPPYGVAVQSDAAGAKLSGVVFLEYFNMSADGSTADARIAVRLRHGSVLQTFYGEAAGVNVSSPAANQAAVTAAVSEDILAFLGETGTAEIALKNLSDFGNVDPCVMPATSNCVYQAQFDPFHQTQVSIADLTIAVK